MKNVKAICAYLLCLSLFLSCTACGNNANPSYPSEDKDIISEGTMTDEAVIIATPIDPIEESTFPVRTQQPSYIKSNPFKSSINYEDKLIERLYEAKVSGIYRFDFELTTDVNAKFRFEIRDQTNLVLKEVYLSDDEGATVGLEKDQVYHVYIEQNNGLSDFNMTIGVPHPIVKISDQTYNDSITYTHQENHYKYTAPITGRYRFDFDPSDYTARYGVMLFDSAKDKKREEYYKGIDGITVDLAEGETYDIYFIQNDGFCRYTMNIGIPTESKHIIGNQLKGTFTYIDELKIYTFSVPVSGDYLFQYASSDVTTNYNFNLLSSKKETIIEKYRLSDSDESKVALTAGQTYTAYVEQNDGYCDYQITFDLIPPETT